MEEIKFQIRSVYNYGKYNKFIEFTLHWDLNFYRDCYFCIFYIDF